MSAEILGVERVEAQLLGRGDHRRQLRRRRGRGRCHHPDQEQTEINTDQERVPSCVFHHRLALFATDDSRCADRESKGRISERVHSSRLGDRRPASAVRSWITTGPSISGRGARRERVRHDGLMGTADLPAVARRAPGGHRGLARRSAMADSARQDERAPRAERPRDGSGRPARPGRYAAMPDNPQPDEIPVPGRPAPPSTPGPDLPEIPRPQEPIAVAALPILQKLSLPRPRAWITPRSIQPRPRCGSIPGRAIGQGFTSLTGTCTACQMLWSASSCTSATTARSSRSIGGSGFGKAPRARGLLGYCSR